METISEHCQLNDISQFYLKLSLHIHLCVFEVSVQLKVQFKVHFWQSYHYNQNATAFMMASEYFCADVAEELNLSSVAL